MKAESKRGSIGTDHAELMDSVYRGQRIIYDLTRKYFLFGRDTLLRALRPKPRARILEVGVGTARNLVLLAKRYSTVELFGLDASQEMLRSADAKVRRAGFSDRITLRQGLAEECDPKKIFGLEELFDIVFFSYSLSMIPDWQSAIERAFVNLVPGGRLYVVDFWDQKSYPSFFKRGLRTWLERFHVRFRPEHIEFLRALAERRGAAFKIHGVGGRYAYIASIERSIGKI